MYEMPLKKGDFALIDFTTKIKESSEIIETTLEKVAKEAKIHLRAHVHRCGRKRSSRRIR